MALSFWWKPQLLFCVRFPNAWWRHTGQGDQVDGAGHGAEADRAGVRPQGGARGWDHDGDAEVFDVGEVSAVHGADHQRAEIEEEAGGKKQQDSETVASVDTR